MEYGTKVAQRVSLAFRAQVRLKKSCEAPESNNMMMGCSNKKNVPARTFSPRGISSTVVKLARQSSETVDGSLPSADCQAVMGLSYPVFKPKPSTHRMYDPGSIVPHIQTKSVHR
jgi:hypothetical protein